MFRKLTVLAMSLLVALAGCQEDDVVSIQPRATYLDADENSIFVVVNAAREWTVDVEYPAGTAPWASVEPASGTGTKADVRLRYQANPSDQERQLTLVLRPGKGTPARVTITQGGRGLGVMGDYGWDLAPNSLNWLELPATESGDGRELLIHDMNGGKYEDRSRSGDRNWSCYWDYDDHLSLWVAYPHNNRLKGSGSRTNAWGYDKLLPAKLQPQLINNSYGGGWTRGHQIPSADRLSYNANVSTFVPTNMTPQEYNFNGGVWADLENQVRNYASKCDTLYVVTGCLFENSFQKSGSSSGFTVKVPTHYFKALLAHPVAWSSAAGGVNGYLAAGFLLPHDASLANANYLKYICTIDQLEADTHIDFFPNLIKVLGEANAAKIEAEEPAKWWK